MRRLFLLVALLLLASPAGATISYIASSANRTLVNTAANTCVVSPGATIATGNDIVVAVSIRTPTNPLASVVDSGSNAYTFMGGITNSTLIREEIWVAHNTTAQLTTSSTITATIAASGTSKMVCMVAGYSGVVGIGRIFTDTFTGTNPSITHTMQDSNNFLVVGFGVNGTGAPSAGTGNLRTSGVTSGGSGGSNCIGALNDNTSASPGSVTNAITSANGNVWVMVTVELRATTAVCSGGINQILAAGNGSNSASSLVITITVTAGHTIVVSAGNDSSLTVSSVTDSGGSTYTQRATIANGADRSEIWSTAAGGAVAGTSITVTFSGTGAVGASASDYSGVQALGTTGTNTGTSTVPTISLTTQDNSNAVVAGFQAHGGVPAAQTTGALRDEREFFSPLEALVDNCAASPSSVTDAITLTSSQAWAATALELRSTTGGGGGTRVPALMTLCVG